MDVFRPIVSTFCGSVIRKWHQQWKQTLCRSHYSQTSFMIRTSKGQNQLSALQRRPYYRGTECMIFGISGTKRTVRNRVNKACKQALFVRVFQASEGKGEPGVKARVSCTFFNSLAWKTGKNSACTFCRQDFKRSWNFPDCMKVMQADDTYLVQFLIDQWYFATFCLSTWLMRVEG